MVLPFQGSPLRPLRTLWREEPGHCGAAGLDAALKRAHQRVVPPATAFDRAPLSSSLCGRAGTRWRQARPPRRSPQAVLVLNPWPEAGADLLSVRDLAGCETLYAFEWGPDRCRPLGSLGQLALRLPAHESALYYLAPTAAGPPQSLRLGSE